jgi:hypothetical protein
MVFSGFRDRLDINRLVNCQRGSIDLFKISTVISNQLTAYVFDSSDALVEVESRAHAFTSQSLTLDKTDHSSCYYAKLKQWIHIHYSSATITICVIFLNFLPSSTRTDPGLRKG